MICDCCFSKRRLYSTNWVSYLLFLLFSCSNYSLRGPFFLSFSKTILNSYIDLKTVSRSSLYAKQSFFKFWIWFCKSRFSCAHSLKLVLDFSSYLSWQSHFYILSFCDINSFFIYISWFKSWTILLYFVSNLLKYFSRNYFCSFEKVWFSIVALVFIVSWCSTLSNCSTDFSYSFFI